MLDRLWVHQTSVEAQYAAAHRSIYMEVVLPAPPAPDPALRDELDAMWAELDGLREQVKSQPDREVVVKGFGA